MKIEERIAFAANAYTMTIATEEVDLRVGAVFDIARKLAALLRDMQASDVWAEGRGSRNADVLYLRMCSLLDGEDL